MKIIDPDIMQQMNILFDQGSGIRATARETGLHRDTVAKYYHQRGPTRCQCGKPMTHRGWCTFRVSRSPGRQKFLASRAAIKGSTKAKWAAITDLQANRTRYAHALAMLEVGWTRQATIRENEILGTSMLLFLAKEACFTRCVPQIFDDVVQDILVEMLSGNIEAQTVKASPAVDRIINRNYKLLLPASNVSLDSPFGDGRESYIENLSNDTPLYDEAIVTKG